MARPRKVQVSSSPSSPGGFAMLKASLRPSSDDPIDSIVGEIRQLLQTRIAESRAYTERLQSIEASLPK